MSRADAGSLIEFTTAITGGWGAPFELRWIRTEPLRPDEILVEVAATGVYQTDAHSRVQDLPVPLPACLVTKAPESSPRSGAPSLVSRSVITSR